MNSFKKILFWTTFIPVCLVITVVGILASLMQASIDAIEWLLDKFSLYEGWCLRYSDTYRYLGSGFWTSRGSASGSEEIALTQNKKGPYEI